jgi:hypothetical protein
MRARASGFTFIEALACLLVVGLGIAAAVSLTYYAAIMSGSAQSKATGMATALTVAIDPAPLMHSSASASWNHGAGGGTNGIGTISGWLNGYYVVRTESIGPQPCPGFFNDPILVDVYDGARGNLITSYTTWVMKQPFSP